MFLLHQLLLLSKDGRQEVRDGAISTVFRSISTYGATLSSATWHACMWEIVFPLVDALPAGLELALREPIASEEPSELVVQVNGGPIRLMEKQWDDSKTLALSSIGDLMSDNLVSKLFELEAFAEVWQAFVDLVRQSFLDSRPLVATTAMKALEKVLAVTGLQGLDPTRLGAAWQVAWMAWDEIGSVIIDSTKSFTQVNLESYVRIVTPLYSTHYIMFDLVRIQRLLAILKSVLTFTRSPDYRPDIDTLTPLQACILEIIAAIDIQKTPGAASLVLTDLAAYLQLAYSAAFDAQPSGGPNGRSMPLQRVTYIALSKEVMPAVLQLFVDFRGDPSIYEGQAVEKMLKVRSTSLFLYLALFTHILVCSGLLCAYWPQA